MSAYQPGLENVEPRAGGSLFLAMDSRMMLKLSPQVTIGESLFANGYSHFGKPSGKTSDLPLYHMDTVRVL